MMKLTKILRIIKIKIMMTRKTKNSKLVILINLLKSKVVDAAEFKIAYVKIQHFCTHRNNSFLYFVIVMFLVSLYNLWKHTLNLSNYYLICNYYKSLNKKLWKITKIKINSCIVKSEGGWVPDSAHHALYSRVVLSRIFSKSRVLSHQLNYSDPLQKLEILETFLCRLVRRTSHLNWKTLR